MRIGIVGSRYAAEQVKLDILRQIPENTTEIVSGGAAGVDSYASELAELLHIPLKVFLPEYDKYGKRAPLLRNLEIIRYADEILAFWDGRSAGTRFVISACVKEGKAVRVIPVGGREQRKCPFSTDRAENEAVLPVKNGRKAGK